MQPVISVFPSDLVVHFSSAIRAISIDNNALERDIRPVAIGRKNWLFAGSPRGGHAAAIFFTLVESCKRAGHNTFEYMKDVLTRIGDHPVNRLDELLPDRWKPGG